MRAKGYQPVVTGFARSGTSMMIEALEVAGMEAHYSREQGVLLVCQECGHAPHTGGPCPFAVTGCTCRISTPERDPERHYEATREEMEDPAFPCNQDGAIVKAWPSQILKAECPIRAIWMHRTSGEIYASYKRAFGSPPWLSPERLKALQRQRWRELQAQPNVDLIYLPYPFVVARPGMAFKMVSTFLGLSLDIEAAAAVVDPSKYRIKEMAGAG